MQENPPKENGTSENLEFLFLRNIASNQLDFFFYQRGVFLPWSKVFQMANFNDIMLSKGQLNSMSYLHTFSLVLFYQRNI